MKSLPRKGLTLTELLVVTVILMSLLGIVVSGLSRRMDGDIRHGAQQFASLLLASQSLSLGSPTGAAVIIDSQGAYGDTFAQARRFPFIEGTVRWTGTTTSSRTATLSPTNDEPAALVHGYKIRFLERVAGNDGPVSDWFALSCEAPPTAVVRLRGENGQTSRTVLWPATPTSGTLSFQAARYPIPAGLSQALPAGVAIDLRYSGYGDVGVADWAALAGRGAIAVGFDSVGSVDAVMQNVLPAGGARTVQPITPCEQVYFFITLRAEIEDPSINALASEKALWVVLHPRTGRVTIAPNVPQQAADAAALWKAREKARQGASIGG